MKNLLKQAIQFFGLSGIGWILDFSIYTILGLVNSNVIVNNIISSWVGVTFVFIFSTHKIFKNNSKISLKWKYLIYLSYQVILIFLISNLLGYIDDFIVLHIGYSAIVKFSNIIAKIIVTPVTMLLNFIFMKSIIEKI